MNDERQRVVRVAGSRRAKLTPAPGTSPEADAGGEPTTTGDAPAQGPNDERMLREIPPHY